MVSVQVLIGDSVSWLLYSDCIVGFGLDLEVVGRLPDRTQLGLLLF